MSKILSLNTTTSNTAKALLIGTSLSVSLFLVYKRHLWPKSRPLVAKTRSTETQTDGCVGSTLQVLKVNGTSSPTKQTPNNRPVSTGVATSGDVYPAHRQRTNSFRNSLTRNLDEAFAQSFS
ncbi:unnamed protein product, partial [Oppiella nova]